MLYNAQNPLHTFPVTYP